MRQTNQPEHVTAPWWPFAGMLLAAGLLLCQCNLGYDPSSVALRDASVTDTPVDLQLDPTADPQEDPVVTPDQGADPDQGQDLVVEPTIDMPDEEIVSECAPVDLESTLGRAVASGDTTTAGNGYSGSCGGQNAPEVIYRWTPPFESIFHFDTFGSRIPTAIYIRADDCDGTELECHVRTSTLFHTGIDLVAGEGDNLIIFVDGQSDQSGRYTLNILDMNEIETDCDNELDEDSDGSPDCRDPGCQGTEACVPGDVPTGEACAANNECSATENDPLCLRLAFSQTWTGGYCSEFCSVEDDPCTGDAVCQILPGVPWGVCLSTCSVAIEPTGCRDGYTCMPFGEHPGVCLPAVN
ncbi:MAG: hypothetical protein JW797_18870 [Bradymonadales bacterium]|nr:hypothetical protein [Bradymonadales bacterium]